MASKVSKKFMSPRFIPSRPHLLLVPPIRFLMSGVRTGIEGHGGPSNMRTPNVPRIRSLMGGFDPLAIRGVGRRPRGPTAAT